MAEADTPFVEQGCAFAPMGWRRGQTAGMAAVMNRRPFSSLLLAIAALASGTPVLAEDDPRADIVVTGEAEAGEADTGEVRQQARAVTPRGGVIGEPLARFQQPLCVGVWGLSGQSAQFVIDRVYHNAEAAGLALDETPGCAANVIVAFVADPQAEFAALVAARHQIVNGLSFDEKQRVRATQGPALAWYLVSTRTRDGQARNGRPPAFDTTAYSRLEAGTRRDLELSVVMIDSDLLSDLDALALADYATMRALARTRSVERGENPTASVLALFDDPVRSPQAMTEFDRAYLASLYASSANMPGHLALRDIDERMEQATSE